MSEPALLIVIRHGETAANTGGIWHGSTDTPLSERGRRQAEAVGAFVRSRYPQVSAVVSSPLERARHTGDAVARALGHERRTLPELTEFHLGSWEGKSYRELHETHQLWHHMKQDPHFAPHGGETPRQVTDRITGALHAIARDHAGQHIAVVAHGGALSMAFAELIDGDYTQWGRVMGNCAVSELVLEPAPKLLAFDQQAHLEGL